MAKRKRTATANRAVESQSKGTCVDEKDKQMENKDEAFSDPDVERQVTALRAICDMEIESLLMGVRLLRSYFNEEQLSTPVLQFFEENHPNVSVINENDGEVDLKWKHQEDIHASLLRRMSMAYHRFSEAWQPFSGFPFPSTTGLAGNSMLDVTSILSAGNHEFEDSYQSLALDLQDGFQTPGLIICEHKSAIQVRDRLTFLHSFNPNRRECNEGPTVA